MAVSVLWTVLLAAALGWEAWCRSAGRGLPSLLDLSAALRRRRRGTLLLVAVWAFVGWHVFARYTL